VVPIVLEREEGADGRAGFEGGGRLLSHDTDDTRACQYLAEQAPGRPRRLPAGTATTLRGRARLHPGNRPGIAATRRHRGLGLGT
jgi:hypothetical protein